MPFAHKESHTPQTPARQELVPVETIVKKVQPVLVKDLNNWRQILSQPVDSQKMYYIHPSEGDITQRPSQDSQGNVYGHAREILKQQATLLEGVSGHKETTKYDVQMNLKRKLLSENNLKRLRVIADKLDEKLSSLSNDERNTIGWLQVLLRELNEVKMDVVGQEKNAQQQEYAMLAEKILSVSLGRGESYRRRERNRWEEHDETEDMRGRYRYEGEFHEEFTAKGRVKNAKDQARAEFWEEQEENVQYTTVAGLSLVASVGVGALAYLLSKTSSPEGLAYYIIDYSLTAVAAVGGGVSSLVALIGTVNILPDLISYGWKRLGIGIQGMMWKHQEKVEQKRNS